MLRFEDGVLTLCPSEDIAGPQELEVLTVEQGPVRFYDRGKLRPPGAPWFEVERLGGDSRTLARIYFASQPPATPVVSVRRWPHALAGELQEGHTLEPQSENSVLGSGSILGEPLPLLPATTHPAVTIATLRAFLRDWQRFDLHRWAMAQEIHVEDPRLCRIGSTLAPVVRVVVPLLPRNPLSELDRGTAGSALERVLQGWDLDGNWLQVELEVLKP